MSGHSRWAKIKHVKGKEDARRGKLFSRLIREITVAARGAGGGDPDQNPRLRVVMQAARDANMPKSNIDNAILRGTGGMEGATYEESTFEGYGPGGVAILIEVLTDNKKRTAADVRHVLSKGGGNMGEAGCVSWMFSKKGILHVAASDVTEERLMEVALDAGAEDVELQPEDQAFEVTTAPGDYLKVREAMEKASIKIQDGEIAMVPQSTVPLKGKEAEQALRLMETIEELDDVRNAYSNFDIPAEELKALGH